MLNNCSLNIAEFDKVSREVFTSHLAAWGIDDEQNFHANMQGLTWSYLPSAGLELLRYLRLMI